MTQKHAVTILIYDMTQDEKSKCVILLKGNLWKSDPYLILGRSVSFHRVGVEEDKVWNCPQ